MTQEELHHYHSLQEILSHGRLTALFQPIISLHHQKIFGYEATIRGPSDGPLHSPVTLFDTALKHDCLAELDLLCRETAIKRYGQLGLKEKPCIHTTPGHLLDKH